MMEARRRIENGGCRLVGVLDPKLPAGDPVGDDGAELMVQLCDMCRDNVVRSLRDAR